MEEWDRESSFFVCVFFLSLQSQVGRFSKVQAREVTHTCAPASLFCAVVDAVPASLSHASSSQLTQVSTCRALQPTGWHAATLRPRGALAFCAIVLSLIFPFSPPPRPLLTLSTHTMPSLRFAMNPSDGVTVEVVQVEAPPPPPPPPPSLPLGLAAPTSTSSGAFLLYAAVGFAGTLGVILLLLSAALAARAAHAVRARREAVASVRARADEPADPPRPPLKPTFLVLQPGGGATVGVAESASPATAAKAAATGAVTPSPARAKGGRPPRRPSSGLIPALRPFRPPSADRGGERPPVRRESFGVVCCCFFCCVFFVLFFSFRAPPVRKKNCEQNTKLLC